MIKFAIVNTTNFRIDGFIFESIHYPLIHRLTHNELNPNNFPI